MWAGLKYMNSYINSCRVSYIESCSGFEMFNKQIRHNKRQDIELSKCFDLLYGPNVRCGTHCSRTGKNKKDEN